MGDDLRFRPSRMVAPLLATLITLVLGTAFCIVIVLGAGEARPGPILVAVGGALGFGLMLWSWRDRPQANQRNLFGWMISRRHRAEQSSYRLSVIRHKHQYGQNQPPTLDQIREIKDPTRTWVPTRGTGDTPSADTPQGT